MMDDLYQKHFHPSSIQLKMFKCISCKNYSARFSGCNETKSSMHSGEVPGDELTHLDEEEANSNHMN